MTDRRTFLKLTVGTLAAGVALPWLPTTAIAVETPTRPFPVRQSFIPELWVSRPGQTAHHVFNMEVLADVVYIVDHEHYCCFLVESLIEVQNKRDLRERYKAKATAVLDRELFFAQLASIQGPGRPLLVKARQYVQLLHLSDFVQADPSWRVLDADSVYPTWTRGQLSDVDVVGVVGNPLDVPVGTWHGRPVYLRDA